MRTSFALALALVSSAAAAAQTMQAPTTGAMTSLEVGIEPMMRVPTATYVAEADAFDAWTIATCRLASVRSRSPAVLAFARTAGPAHAAALKARGGRPITDASLVASLAALRASEPARFDAEFAARQTAVHRRAWALHSGYAADGGDPGLRRSAAEAVAREERDLQSLPLKPMPY